MAFKKLGRSNYDLLAEGVGLDGNYVEAYYYAEEYFTISKAPIILEFCKYLTKNNFRMGWGTFEERFTEFINKK
jgi:hypothetical protein